MASIDWPLEKLVEYKPALTAAPDFNAFWDAQLVQSEKVPLNGEFAELSDSLPLARVYDATFDGADGVRVRGWFLTPREVKKPLPAVVQFIGYTGGRDYSHALAPHVLNGFCAFIMDSRGQGGNTGMKLDTSHGGSRGSLPTASSTRTNTISATSTSTLCARWNWSAPAPRWIPSGWRPSAAARAGP